MPKPVLVTGAEGFIGSHLVEQLVQAGHRARAMVLYNAFDSRGWLDRVDRHVLDEVEILVSDVRDAHAVTEAMRGCRSAAHLAALIGIPYSYHSPEAYVETNVRGTLNVLQAARTLGIEHLVHTSTSEVYGSARHVPMSEEHPLNAQSPYAATKIAADQLALSFHASFGLPVTVLRPFNTFGPRQSLRAVIPAIITQLARGATTLRLGSLTPTRDFNFVTDVARAFCAALTTDAGVGRVINIGSGHDISIGDLARLIGDEMATRFEFQTDQARVRPTSSEVERLLADNALAGKLLGWAPEHSGRDGLCLRLRETIAWFRDRANLVLYREAGFAL